MKKLLISTAIVGAVAFAPVANASDLQVNVGGFLNFEAGYTSDDIVDDHSTATHNNNNVINAGTDAEIHFTVNGKADNGLEYGAVIELEAQVGQADTRNGGDNADKAYLFAQGGWGRVEAGENTDAAQAIGVSTENFASATGGVGGDFYRYTVVPATSGGAGRGFITRPELPISLSGGTGGGAGLSPTTSGDTNNQDSDKITYYSPRVMGFQAGVSYIPNTDDAGTVPNLANVGYRNVLSGGVNYASEFSGVGVKAAVTGQTGAEKQRTNANSLEAWNAGLNLSAAGFTGGVSYGDFGDTLGSVGNHDAHYWDAGLAYATGPWSASATYLSSTTENTTGTNDKFHNLVIGADYKAAPGLVPFVEASFFDYNGGAGNGITEDNDGTVVIAGSKLTF